MELFFKLLIQNIYSKYAKTENKTLKAQSV